jgi:hypothetical protein
VPPPLLQHQCSGAPSGSQMLPRRAAPSRAVWACTYRARVRCATCPVLSSSHACDPVVQTQLTRCLRNIKWGPPCEL